MPPSLWRHSDFRRLWLGQTISEIGSRITRDGVPLAAVIVLKASPMEMGVLASLHGLSALLAGAAAGNVADRRKRRPILIAADVGRALVLLTVPAAAALGYLSMWQLYAVVFAAGILTIFFDVAYQSYLPSLVPSGQLLEGNSKLAISAGAAEVLGPGITGVLVQTLTAPRAILLDSLSFLVSAVSIVLIRTPKPPPVAREQGRTVDELSAGLRYVAANPVLRALVLCAATVALFIGFLSTLYVFYAITVLGLTPAALGVVISLGSVGSLVGAAISEHLSRRIPVGLILIGCSLLTGVTTLLVPLAHGPAWAAALYLGAAQLFGDVSYPIYSVHELTLRQKMAPPEILGRVNACLHLAFKGVWPAGALLGGVLGTALGVRPTMGVCSVGVLLSTLFLVLSPVARLREVPTPARSA